MRSILFLLILCQLPLNIYASDVNIGFEEGLKGWECYAADVPSSITNKSINDSSFGVILSQLRIVRGVFQLLPIKIVVI